jgi:hypothetical protein
MIVVIFLVGGQVPEAVAGDVNDVVLDGEDLPEIFAFRVLEPGGKPSEVLAVEELDEAFGGDRLVRCILTFARAGCRQNDREQKIPA